jgi:hypothetical protein
MFGFLRRFFSVSIDDVVDIPATVVEGSLQHEQTQTDDLASAASDHRYRAHFLQLLLERGLWGIVRLDRESNQDNEVHFLEYEDGPSRILPMFSSPEHATAFIHTTEFSELLPLQCIHVPAQFLVINDLSGLRVIMNPRSGTSTEIGYGDLLSIRNYLHQQL